MKVISDTQIPFYPDLLKRLDLPKYNREKDNYDEIINKMDFMWYDPDMIRCDDETYPFIEIDGTIITFGEVDEKVQTMLIQFFKEDFKKHYKSLEPKWDNFYSLENAIAYRGGKGYFYSVWQYIN